MYMYVYIYNMSGQPVSVAGSTQLPKPASIQESNSLGSRPPG